MIRWESGGRADGAPHRDPSDPGGDTRYGIAQRWHPRLKVLELTSAQAIDVYRLEYWLAGKCDRMPPPVALVHFDALVNGIPDPPGRKGYSAGHVLQEALGVKADGAVGPRTLAALERATHPLGPMSPTELAFLLVRARAGAVVRYGDPAHRAGIVDRCLDLVAFVATL